MENTEIWRDIEGYEGLYQVSNMGRVKSLDRIVITKKGSSMHIKGKILKSCIVSCNYLGLDLCKNGTITPTLVHRLVAQAFIPNPDNKPTVDHINRHRDDNRASNLRWATSYEQMNFNDQDVYKDIKRSVSQYTLDGCFIRNWNSTRDIERETGISHSYISECCNGKWEKACGYIWKYAS